jgi:hypothetical protein
VVSHFQQWVDGGLKPAGLKDFELELIHGTSVGALEGRATGLDLQVVSP